MQTGDTVEDFAARLDDGREVRLSELLAGGPVVLFFYPKAFTAGCTAEACHFRDLGAEFAEIGAQRVGVSRDDPGTQARFRSEHGLDYPLIADTDGAVAKLFGAKRIGPLWSKRQTFVVDTDRTVLAAIASESDMEVHADEALAVLRDQAAAA
jgi:peroxiredoxin Q/BCP